jgi:chromosome partitioning protein
MIRVLFNKKGGVGKSSLTCNLAAISAAKGLKTLVIDLDTQCNASQYLLNGISSPELRINSPELRISSLELKNSSREPRINSLDQITDNMAQFYDQTITFHIRKKPTIEFVSPTAFENLDIIPSSPELDQLHTKLESRHKIYKLKEGLEQLKDHYDRIYIDTAPALNFYSLSALIAADRCLIPMDCDEFSRQAIYNMMQHLAEIKEDHNPALEIEGIIANQFMARAKVPLKIINELKAEGHKVLDSKLSSSVKMRESHQVHTPLIHLAPKHKLTLELVALWMEIEGQALEIGQK